ncbi:tripartite tricarboxylate transporter TctB family protein [Variibacter gotjawalensis]|uniref:Tripartite tricarboxylate transporter TctB family protein n=1 Tax=Variibacter gotjawalensis TaxID=1333996 RepID=A0A0S3PT75_9BRAD|nr:tripartite tricarboxylate transporter TctB family protein [Variibacter gotjawalensis]NIK49466.1 hypothetical protein [Variibacter gotjawalensis]RZS51318.1 tripartite tricarboxylate transporter TctB family protein [Variibacter gotjawalensis]BAT59151.1 tripartite tricarboxylate transporter TctB family protein [Variibacter gotjawalensis]
MTDHASSPTPSFWHADRIGGLIWVILGGAIVYGSWTMDRLEGRIETPLAAPGLVPGLLGLGLIIFGAILLARRIPIGASDAEEASWLRVVVSWALCFTYAGLLLGRGVPYIALTAAFLFAHLVLIGEQTLGKWPEKRRLITIILVVAIVPVLVGSIFQYVFLVRLP